jgi:hypothetical protein
MAISGEDLAEPQSSMIVEILAAQGITISPQAIQNMVLAKKAEQQAAQQVALTKANPVLGLMAEPPAPEPQPPQPGMPGAPPVNPQTPGPADKAPRLDQHQLDLTGQLPGAGATAGMGQPPAGGVG